MDHVTSPMLDAAAALAVVLDRVSPPPRASAARVPLLDAIGQVLAEDVVADLDLPPFARATMDGFAVRSGAAPAGRELAVVGTAAAGVPCGVAVGPGQAARIFTGAPLPAGADAVVMVERTREPRPGCVVLDEAPAAGQNVAARGEDLTAGAVALAAGTRVDAAHVGLLASLGATRPLVLPRPRVAVLATGSELVPPHESPPFGKIRESNGMAAAALVAAAGGVPVPLGIVEDDPARIRERAAEGLACDLLLLSGGSSVGDFDFTPRVLAELGVAVHFDRIALKPGKPTTFGTRGDAAVFGLPGNPVSAFVVFHLLVRAAIARRAGLAADDAAPRFVPARFDARGGAVRRVGARDQLLPVATGERDGALAAALCGWHGSGDVTCLRRADALAWFERGSGDVADGDATSLLPIGLPARAGAPLRARDSR